MSNGIQVRPCRPADVSILAAAQPPGSRLAEQFFERQQAGEIVYLVGWLDGAPVGTGVLTWGEQPELKNLHVREAFRGNGVGGAIVAAAEELAADAGLLVIGVGVDNPGARRLYERLGYRSTGRLTTTTYRFHDDAGTEHEATETAEDLEKALVVAGTTLPNMPARSTTVLRHQHLIVTVFGLYRDLRGAIPIAALIRMLGELGVEPAGVRSSVARLKKREILISTTLDGAAAYALAPQLQEVFADGDRRIFARHTDPPAPDPEWLLATFTVPEAERHLRHRLRVLLGRWGFGTVAAGLWIAPIGVADAVRGRLVREGLDRYVDFFTARYPDTDRLRTKVASWWDLDGLERQYLAFVERHRDESLQNTGRQIGKPAEKNGGSPTGDEFVAASERAAFVGYVPLVTEWRQLPYLDPGLPADLLPPGWHGRAAEELFMRLHQQWAAPSRKHAEALLRGK